MVDVGDRGALCDRNLPCATPQLAKVVIGFALISHGTNLLLLTTGKLKRGAVPILVEGYQGPYVDPLPQALILTAIVISFAVTAFMLALVYRTYQSLGTDDLDRLRRPPG